MNEVNEEVILVDENDRAIGSKEKLSAHVEGRLHRAFSIFVLDSEGQALLQQRSGSKYHSRMLWSNTCCGHPRPGEYIETAAHRRLVEEMGFDCELSAVVSLMYNLEVGEHLFEHEYNHIFIGRFDGKPSPNLAEVADWKWVALGELRNNMSTWPARYTSWLAATTERVWLSLSKQESERSD
jgi:isopentenyl-diphosphate Delta-isomerase